MCDVRCVMYDVAQLYHGCSFYNHFFLLVTIVRLFSVSSVASHTARFRMLIELSEPGCVGYLKSGMLLFKIYFDGT